MKRIVKIGFRHANSVPFRAPSHPAPQYARGLRAPAKRPLRDGDCSIREQHSRAPAVLDRQTRESRRRVFPVLRADKPTHAIAAGSRVSAVCTSDTRTANARLRGSRRRNEGSVRRMKRIVKIGFHHANSVPFRAPSHPAPQHARGLRAPAKRPLRDGDRSIREQHSRAPAVLDRQTRESRRRVFPVLRADKPTHAIAAGSRVSAVCARNTRTSNARTRGSRQRDEGSVRRMKRTVKIGFRHADSVPFRAPSHPAPQHARRLYAPAKLPLWESNLSIRERHSCASAISERQPRECARRRHVVLAFRVDKPVPTSIAGSHASAICARGNRTANAQRAEAVSTLSSFSARTSPPTQSLPEVACLSYAPAIPERQPRERARRRRVVLTFRVDKPVPTNIAGSRASAVCARDTRTANARTRGSRQRDEGSVRRMKRTVKIGFRHADSVPFRAPSHPAPQYARRLYAPAKLPLWESNLSIRERHSCAPAIPERQPRERARRRRVVLAFRVDKPIPTNIAGSRASAVYACSNRTANAQRAEAVSTLSSFSARTSPPTQSLTEVAYLPYAPATPERQTRECARRRRVVLAFRVDKPVPTSIAGSHSSAVCACGNRPENAQRAEDVSASFPFSARTRPPTQSLPEVAYLPYAPATPERQTREHARRRRVVLAFRVDKPIPTNIAGSRASAVCACSNRPANAQRAEAVSTLSSFSARTRPPTQSLPEVAYLPYAPTISERQPRERAGAVSGTKGACAG